jgi:MoxR-like ATPase
LNVYEVKVGEDLIKLTMLCFRANLPVLFEGMHGVGKSAVPKQAAERLKIGYRSVDLSIREPSDLVGNPKIDEAKGVTVFFPPPELPREGDGSGILCLEELNRAPAYMRAPALQLLTERVVHNHALPNSATERWLPMATINPSDSIYDVFLLDPALLSRFVVIRVVADRREWLRCEMSRRRDCLRGV